MYRLEIITGGLVARRQLVTDIVIDHIQSDRRRLASWMWDAETGATERRW